MSNTYEKDEYGRAKAYFDNLLADTEPDMLPEGDVNNEPVSAGSFLIPSESVAAEIENFCENNSLSKTAFFHAVFAFVLGKYNLSENVLYITACSGGEDIGPERTMTMPDMTFPVVCHLDEEQTITAFVRDVDRQLADSMGNDTCSFEEIAREHQIAPDVVFTCQGGAFPLKVKDVESSEEYPQEPDETGALLHIDISEQDSRLLFSGEYRKDRYSDDYINHMVACLQQVVREFLTKAVLKDVCLTDAHTCAEMDAFNATETDWPETDVVSMFRAAAEKYPDREAVIFKDEVLSYREVDECSERIAGFLRANGVGSGTVVSILIHRGSAMVTATLGALKTGAAYQPLDPGYPPERLDFMMKDADCAFLIADEDLLERVPDYKGPVLLTKDFSSLPACEKLTDHPAPEDLFILLYTSGTTGVPKGVMLEHRNLANFVRFYRTAFQLDESCRVFAYASYGFDACMMDLFSPLTAGACVCIVEEEIRLNLVAVEALLNRRGITHGFMTTQVARQFYTMATVPSLRYLLTGGETLVPVAPRTDVDTKLINIYGPTECTIMAACTEVDRLYERVPIGTPHINCKCYVVDANLNRLPPFIPGELLISGRGVGRGYLNRPDVTEKVYIRNPFSNDPAFARAYRTGDVVRLLPDGNIDFIGRRDGQVKVRGFRIELTEVEGVVREFPGISDATVQAFEDAGTGEKFITAYVVADGEVDVSALNDFIRERKPAYMVPAVTMQIDSIPLNQNSKVNKRALPKPEPKIHAEAAGAGGAAPLNALEKELKEIVSEIVGTTQFGITDLFGELGLSSISSIRLAMQVYKRFNIQLDTRKLIGEGCIQSIENEILESFLKGETQGPVSPAAEAAEEKKPAAESCRLSFAQQGVYTEYNANPDTVQYNLPFVMRFPEGISAQQLEAAVRSVVDAHPYVLCRFVPDDDGEIIQEPIPDFKLEIPVTELPAGEFEAHKEAFVRPFDLAKGPGVRFEIVKTDGLVLLADMHHLVCDGASIDLFISQLCSALDGETPEMESYSYYDFASEEKISPETEEFFAGQMANAEDATMLLPDVFDEGLTHTERSESVPTDFAAVKEFARETGVTPAAVYLAACYLTFGRYVCEDTVAIATISNGRGNLKVGSTMGMFVNTLPLVMSIDHSETAADFVRRAAKGFSDTIAHENYPYARIAAKYDFRASISYAYQIGVVNEYHTKYGPAETELLSQDIAKLPVSIFIDGTEDAACINVAYDSALYSAGMMRGLAESIENAVRGLLTCRTLSEISLTEEAQWTVLDSYNRSWDLNYDSSDTVVTRFKKNVQAQPDKTAAVYKDKAYTYRELDELTDRLAAKLWKRACESSGKDSLKEEVVAILLPRDENVFILPLAAVKAGLAYEPLDPGYPKERLNFMVKDAGVCLLLAEESLRELVDEYEGPVLTVSELYAMEDETAEPAGPAPEDLFILLYTSGTTGTPKGCQIEHRNVVSYAYGVRNDFYTKEDRIAAYASFGFDVNMSDVFCTLLNGATVYLIPEEIRMDLKALADYFDEAGITALLLTTQVGVQFLLNYPNMKTLRMLVMGGEKLPAVDPSSLSYTIVNGYGPTENCCGVSLFPIPEWEPNIPIGKPMRTIHAYVLDKTGHRLPAGAAGEYCLSGPQVSRGYLNRPDKTAEAYEPCPFNEFRMYHTGDIVRYRQNGDVEFVGRRDGQVKIRGFRIETKEVESVIRGFAGVRDVTVQAYDYETGGKYLAAFVTGDAEVDVAALTEYIKTQKPAYMVPPVIMQIDEIPLTINQKVDKKALPEPSIQKAANAAPEGITEEDFCAIVDSVLSSDERDSAAFARKVVMAVEKAGYVIVPKDYIDAAGTGGAAPLNALEQELKEIVSEIVGTTQFGVTDLFGELGLSSISSIRLAMQVYKRFNIQLDTRKLIAEGSIQSIENEILTGSMNGEQQGPEIQAEESAEERRPAAQSCRLSFAQQGVYTEYQANPDTVQYNIPLAVRFPEGISAQQLETAVRRVVYAHPYILCRFVPDDDGEIFQEPIPEFKLEIPVTELPAGEFEAHKEAFVRPFDLAKGPGVRFEIVKTDSLILLMDMHHLVSDGASVDLFISQLCSALDGEEPEEESYSYYDFASEEEISPEEEEFFAGQMANAEDATQLLPDVFDEGLPHTEKNASVPTDIAAVKEFARETGVTPAAVYLAACYLTFGRYVCEDTVAIATVSSGRGNLKVGSTMGMFVNTLPLVMSIDHSETAADFVRRAAEGFSDTIAHENYPYARIASQYDFRAAVSYTYQIGIAGEHQTKYGPLQAETMSLDIAKLPVSIYINGTEDAAHIDVTYDSALYSAGMMRGLAESIENAVRGLLTCRTLSEISLTEEAQWTVLDSYNRSWDLNYDSSDTVVTRFKKNVQAQPDKTAAVYKDKAYTYRELDELTDRLAAKLWKRACEASGKDSLKEEVVAILLPRDENVFILPLAAVKAGLAYEPLDPGYPKERLNFMVKDAGVCMLLAEESLRDLVDEYEGPVLTVSELYEMEDETAEPAGPAPEDLFILLYTSGTTGTPKGCQIEHRNVVSYAYGVRNDFYTKEDRIAAYASFGFDVNMSDVFCTLLNGGTVYLIPEEIRMDLKALADYFDEAGITALLLTTQVGVQFLLNYPNMKTLRMLVMGGEKLPAVDPSSLSYTIVNGYGPTENCCGVSLFPILEWEPNIPIGKPMRTIHAYVLDKTGHRLPAGAAGEYCLSGPQVSRGYLNRPDKTAEAYEPCPFNEFRMYHTGDIVRYRQNGDVEFVGRRDGQVKIRGFRIETKEVESVIRGFAGVRDVTVQAYDYETGGKYLAAFVTGDADVDVAALTEYIKTQKPAYMVPSVIMQIDEIPLTINQKVDKKALPEPSIQKAAYVAPVGKTEEDFCAVFGRVLGIEKVSAEDDFFDLGGSSILAMKVVMAAEQAGYSIVYNDVFSHTTPRTMAGFLTGDKEQTTDTAAIPVGNEAQAIVETGRDGYDYRNIHDLLRRNTLEAFRSGERLPLNDVLLTGATGYLGSHVLHELIVNHDSRIFCFVRPGKEQTGQERLQALLRYYFNDDFAELFGSRITVIEGDATAPDALTAFHAPAEDMTVINCAASVKHFARGDEIERANVDSVRNLTAWCEENQARLVHISTGSVAGGRRNGVPPENFRFDEHSLYAGQIIDNNQYIHSKFMAERHVFEEILTHGLRAKVLRMGNLAPRDEDGEFQINYETNSYMNNFRAFQTLGMVSYETMAQPVEFSPIDCLAKAVLALASTPDDCICFIPLNPHRPMISDVVRALNEEGYPVRGVESEEFMAALHEALSDENKREAVSSLAVYNSSDDIQPIGPESCDNSHTLQILERLGISWPETGSTYIRQFLKKLGEKGYFGGSKQ